MQVRDFTLEQVRDFVYDAVGGGASGVFSNVGRIMITAEAATRLRIFINAANHVTELLEVGILPREVKYHILPISDYL